MSAATRRHLAAHGSGFPPELVFGLVTPLGVDIDGVIDQFRRLLKQEVAYQCDLIHLMQQLIDSGKVDPGTVTGLGLIEAKIRLGNKLAETTGLSEAFALYAINGILRARAKQLGISDDNPEKIIDTPPAHRNAYIIRSLKRPEEITTLRRVYGHWFIVVGVFAERDSRVDSILEQLHGEGLVRRRDENEVKGKIQKLLDRDAREDIEFGQNARNAFARADVFIDVSPGARPTSEQSISRLIRLIFQDRTFTPTIEEHAMFHAHAAALRSSSPFRQVGAAIVDDHGEIVSTGTNEVPIAEGGQSWDLWYLGNPDSRDLGHIEGKLFGEVRRKRDLILDTLDRLAAADLLSRDAKEGLEKRSATFIERLQWEVLKDSELMNVVEFQRPVHAEMAALMNAGSHGSIVRDFTMYVTAFPCHICAKHILEAGIKRVVYIEPYPKSRTPEFYSRDVSIDRERLTSGQVSFEPFIGIGPNLYSRLFASQDYDRVDKRGIINTWTGRSNVVPRLGLGDESVLSEQSARSIRVSEVVAVVDLAEVERSLELPVHL